MTLGPVGGFACHLAETAREMAVAEGIETGLSVQMTTGIPTWAALSAGNLAKILLPPLPLAGLVIIAADADVVGVRAAKAAALRWKAEGRRPKAVRSRSWFPPGRGRISTTCWLKPRHEASPYSVRCELFSLRGMQAVAVSRMVEPRY